MGCHSFVEVHKALACIQNPMKISPPSPILTLLEGRALLGIGPYAAISTYLSKNAPKGDGHPVVVLPGFMASDISTLYMRHFLRKLGYRTYGWQLGRNYGNEILRDQSLEEVIKIYEKNGQHAVSLIGWSLGGVYAREIARLAPHIVRQVITMASPFYNISQSSNALVFYEWLNKTSVKEESKELLERLKLPIPVPHTALYSRADGVVDWKSCICHDKDGLCENIEVPGSHSSFGFSPWALLVAADRLAQAEHTWQPFEWTEKRKKWFPPQKY